MRTRFTPLFLAALSSVSFAACSGGGGSQSALPSAPVTAPMGDAGTNAAASLPSASPGASPAASVSADASPSIATTATTSGTATFKGCPVYTAGDYYNANVTASAVDRNSASYISSMRAAGNTAGFYASTGVQRVNIATSATPLMTVHPQVSYHTFPVQYPWTSSFYVSPLSDHHAMVVQTSTCHVYEGYGTRYSSGTLSAFSGANWDLTKPFVPMPAGQPSAMASGLPFFAGMVKYEDYQAGSINHALNWAGIANTVAQYKFVRPASDTDWLTFRGTGLQLPYGAHLRLKASFSTAGMGPQATMVIKAMKTYGIYLADTGSSGNALYFANSSTGSNPWNGSDLSALGKVHITDFDVLTLPTINTVPGH